ncbi:NAD(P)H nitroreductase [Virgisporangium aliadipatigenens]|uniref:NAD(P)H nitroreductase n=1 Tax=Virgisporangium aliadipatigenens TaxID=741659 RepID=A0A8J4DSQ0_9ACTN|nr:nitroreductase family protein [Virgisporangium aliadipatigenens]GIJ48103.1 NAD(P)H nitroreductase [Virgisporangium aliadipatigenens]
MPASIQIAPTNARTSTRKNVLTRAAVSALCAPSVFNTQPWRWRITGDTAELRADRSRQLPVLDPDGRLLTVSCGAALHHFRTALAVDGVRPEVTVLPDPVGDPDVLAVIACGPHEEPPTAVIRLFRAMSVRRSDRRPFADEPVPPAVLARLCAAGRIGTAHVQLVRDRDVVGLAVAAVHAAGRELADPDYRAELAAWRRRGDDTRGDGLPGYTAPAPAARPVPVRDLAATGPETATIHDAPPDADRFARYLIVHTENEDPVAWLDAGEALSAVLLTATVEGLSASPMSDLVEVPASRQILRELLGGLGHAAIVVRVGITEHRRPTATTPRRGTDDAVDTTERRLSAPQVPAREATGPTTGAGRPDAGRATTRP